MDPKRIETYNKELQAAMGSLKQLLSQAQVTMGVVESFIYLLKKESTDEVPVIDLKA